jgi:hypothetical protein
VLFPYDTRREFATKGKVPVKATFNGLPYTGSLTKYGHPLHSLARDKAKQHSMEIQLEETRAELRRGTKLPKNGE